MDLQTTFQLAEPPRHVPFTLWLRINFGGISQFGWFFVGFGTVFVWLFATNADLSFLQFRGELETAQGRLTHIEETNASENETRVYACHYTFVGPDGQQQQGLSYRTGRRGVQEGAPVTVEFPVGAPHVSRIKGMRRAVFPPFVLFVWIFPIVGLAIVVWRLRRGRKAIRLLRHGRLAQATLKSKKATGAEINDSRVYRMAFEFIADDGLPYELATKTAEPEKLEDDAEERVLYDEWNPRYAEMMDTLPGDPEVDQAGQFKPVGWLALLLLVVPLATLIGHGWYAMQVWSVQD